MLGRLNITVTAQLTARCFVGLAQVVSNELDACCATTAPDPENECAKSCGTEPHTHSHAFRWFYGPSGKRFLRFSCMLVGALVILLANIAELDAHEGH